MKTKVLRYKFDGNTVVAPYMELEPYAENVYVSLSKKNEYGNESEDYFHVVCKINNVYFSCGQYSRRILDEDGHREEAAAYCRNWIANTLKDAEEEKYISVLPIRVFNALGLDPAPLVKAREAYLKRQEQKRMEWKMKEEEKGNWRQSNGNGNLMMPNGIFWPVRKSRRNSSLKLPNVTALTSISGQKAHSTSM